MTWCEGDRFFSKDRALKAAGGDPERLRMLGWGDAPAEAPLAMLDPTGTRRGKPVDAVPCHYHPLRWQELHPELRQMVDEFQICQPQTISTRDYHARSNFELECLQYLVAASSRERARQARASASAAMRAAKRKGPARDDEDEE